jgi:hypothetical protein
MVQWLLQNSASYLQRGLYELNHAEKASTLSFYARLAANQPYCQTAWRVLQQPRSFFGGQGNLSASGFSRNVRFFCVSNELPLASGSSRFPPSAPT